MPHIDGIETTRLINESCTLEKPPIVIMVSSIRQESILKSAKDVGIDIFLQKPINPSILNDILNELFLGKIKQSHKEILNINSKQTNINELVNSNILLVEDNTINQEIILGLLEHSGINIDIASNGKEAIDKYKSNPTKYKLIFMDLQMPVMGGIEATKIIRKLDSNIPIIALTAHAMKEDVEKTKNAGMNEHLNKPIEVNKLFSTLLKYISKNVYKTTTSKKQKDDIQVPTFINLDTKIGLSHMAGNKKLYLKILNDFYNNNKDLKLEELDNTKLERVAHTIKGLAANIGANTLSNIAKELEITLNKELFSKFYKELNIVLEELKDLKSYLKHDVKQTIEPTMQLDDKKREELFAQLIEFIKSRKSKKCYESLRELMKYKLSNHDKDLLVEVEELLDRRKYKKIMEIL